jgi:hypothetical protein
MPETHDLGAFRATAIHPLPIFRVPSLLSTGYDLITVQSRPTPFPARGGSFVFPEDGAGFLSDARPLSPNL